MSRTGKYYKHKPAFTDDLDRELIELEKKAHMIQRLQRIMNTIKANGLYSEKEMARDMQTMDDMNAPQDEQHLITECWHIRKLANEQLMKETKILLKKLKKDMMKNDKGKKPNGTHANKD